MPWHKAQLCTAALFLEATPAPTLPCSPSWCLHACAYGWGKRLLTGNWHWVSVSLVWIRSHSSMTYSDINYTPEAADWSAGTVNAQSDLCVRKNTAPTTTTQATTSVLEKAQGLVGILESSRAWNHLRTSRQVQPYISSLLPKLPIFQEKLFFELMETKLLIKHGPGLCLEDGVEMQRVGKESRWHIWGRRPFGVLIKPGPWPSGKSRVRRGWRGTLWTENYRFFWKPC